MTEAEDTGLAGAAKQALRFVWSHRIHVLLCLPMLIGVTVLHEWAHAVAVVLQGGTVTRISVWPSHGLWGYTHWREPPQGLASPELVALAPYILWLAMAAFAASIAAVPVRKPLWMASTVFVWLYAVPVLDIANAVAGYGRSASGDLGSVFGPSAAYRAVVVAVAGIGLCAAGFPVQRGLYRERALGLGGYAILSAAAVTVLAVLPLL